MAKAFTTANFNEEVLQSEVPVLVDFSGYPVRSLPYAGTRHSPTGRRGTGL